MKLKIGFSIFILLLINIVAAYAQSTPPLPVCGNGGDPDGGCPLDTWVIVLVAVFALFAVYRLHQRNKVINKPSL